MIPPLSFPEAFLFVVSAIAVVIVLVASPDTSKKKRFYAGEPDANAALPIENVRSQALAIGLAAMFFAFFLLALNA